MDVMLLFSVAKMTDRFSSMSRFKSRLSSSLRTPVLDTLYGPALIASVACPGELIHFGSLSFIVSPGFSSCTAPSRMMVLITSITAKVPWG
jgi:hypothetical protein